MTAQTSSPISLSESAARRVSFLVEKEGKPGLMLRVTVSGGGCSGFQYVFSFDERQNPDDIIVESGGARVVVDTLSLMYLTGSEIDFVEDLAGAAFAIRNPNATSSCGCGTSFAV